MPPAPSADVTSYSPMREPGPSVTGNLLRNAPAAGNVSNGDGAEECRDDIPKPIQRFGAVDRRAEVGAVVEPLGIPGVQGSQLVDHPAVVPSCDVDPLACLAGRQAVGLGRRRMAEPFRFTRPLVEQQ